MIKDSAGNEYQVNAIVRMYHFTGARKKKHFMYKQVVEVNEDKGRIGFCHLPIKLTESARLCFSLSKEECERNTVIVESYYSDMRDLKRNPKLRD